jgi:hypothetical protein
LDASLQPHRSILIPEPDLTASCRMSHRSEAAARWSRSHFGSSRMTLRLRSNDMLPRTGIGTSGFVLFVPGFYRPTPRHAPDVGRI